MSSVTAMEQQREKLVKVQDNRDMALKLSKNREFRKLILEEFCVNEAARYVQNSANPTLDAASREDCLNIAQSTGHLKRWLSVQMQMGAQADKDISDIDAALEEARLEEQHDESALEDTEEGYE